MRITALCVLSLALVAGANLNAQDITGDWQGTLHRDTSNFRSINRTSRTDDGAWTISLLLLDQRGFMNPVTASAVSFRDSVLKATFDDVGGVFDAKLSADGNTLHGTWTQRGSTLPFDYHRVTKETEWKDPSPHTVRFVPVDRNVKLEVLDWGGTGRPLVLLAGLGNDAHIFDTFAPKLTPAYHVYGVTRRGFAFSSRPATGYTADRLGDDVVAVIDSLSLKRPVLIGHSIAGEELSSIGSRYPAKVAGLVYLDAGYPYAFYDSTHGNLNIETSDLKAKLDRLWTVAAQGPEEAKRLIHEMLDTDIPAFEKSLRQFEKNLPSSSQSPAPAQPPMTAQMVVSMAIMQGEQKYTNIRPPVLAIFASPHRAPPGMASDSARRAWVHEDSVAIRQIAGAFERGIPSARVVHVPNADHYVFMSNEADVLRETRAFIEGLPREK